MGRAFAAGAAFIAGAGSGVVAALAAADPSVGLWVALGVLVLGGAVLQGAVTVADRRSRLRVVASGAGAVAVAGSARQVRTSVRDAYGAPVTENDADVTASGPGAISIGGDATGPLATDVTGAEGTA